LSERIIPFTYRPVTNRKNGAPLLFVLAGVSAALVVLSLQLERFAGIVSAAAIIFLTLTVMFYLRYVGSDYVYNVTVSGDGIAYFVVGKVVGKKITTMLAIRVSSIQSIQLFTKSGENKYIPDKTKKRHNFNPSFNPVEFAVMSTAGRDGRAEIVLECTPEAAERLLQYSVYAREDERAENEEE
jgi:hypothetical protein